MLHHIKLPDYGNALYEFLQFQQQLVTFVCTPSLSYPLDQQKVCNYFQNPQRDWFYKKLWANGNLNRPTEGYHKPLTALIEHVARCVTNQPQLGQEIIDAYVHDIDFYKHFQDATFRFRYPMLDKETRKYIEELLVACYKLLYDGFPINEQICFTHKDLLKAFRDLNKDMLCVCPMCDGEAPDILKLRNREHIILNEQDHSQVDHFFPKSLYPFLSIHPYNLVPICMKCNKSKSNIDPLTTGHLLVDTFHPYERPAVDEIDVRVKVREVSIFDMHSSEIALPSTRLQNLDRVTKLANVWEDNALPYFVNTLIDRLRDTANDLQFEGETITRNHISNELSNHCRNRARKVGRQQHYLVTSSYANYASTDKDELETLMAAAMRIA